ncbi:STAS-like domain-containing protein [Algoriphagus aquimarinus]|uniref:DUF4325 domain-containing protein n=1 Tax=Algoriphagus aquimarinus TaxID=237018 RepID=A0A5C7AS40_9BACT|nr:DUF4325 domain-containing protein [Algoriphagus aquimarinus]TXE11231.1 DUF4325 domain-containing protein [Algoriphagus aquimarinus]
MKFSHDNVINLEDHRTPKAKVFTGRDLGRKARVKSEINRIENEFESVSIIIPDNVYSIIPSFFEELFMDVVLKLGKENFLKKFNFVSEGSYKYEKPLNEAIERILRDNTAIG